MRLTLIKLSIGTLKKWRGHLLLGFGILLVLPSIIFVSYLATYLFKTVDTDIRLRVANRDMEAKLEPLIAEREEWNSKNQQVRSLEEETRTGAALLQDIASLQSSINEFESRFESLVRQAEQRSRALRSLMNQMMSLRQNLGSKLVDISYLTDEFPGVSELKEWPDVVALVSAINELVIQRTELYAELAKVSEEVTRYPEFRSDLEIKKRTLEDQLGEVERNIELKRMEYDELLRKLEHEWFEPSVARAFVLQQKQNLEKQLRDLETKRDVLQSQLVEVTGLVNALAEIPTALQIIEERLRKIEERTDELVTMEEQLRQDFTKKFHQTQEDLVLHRLVIFGQWRWAAALYFGGTFGCALSHLGLFYQQGGKYYRPKKNSRPLCWYNFVALAVPLWGRTRRSPIVMYGYPSRWISYAQSLLVFAYPMIYIGAFVELVL